MCKCQIVGNWGIREVKYLCVCVSDSGEMGNWRGEICLCHIVGN